MVNILHHHPKGEVVDAPALEQFQKDWALYRTLVEHDALFHRAVADHLHDALATAFDRPFSLVDLACGDAFVVRGALDGTKVAHYHGIDLSMPALELASRTLDGAPFEVVLDHADFVEAVTARDTHADAFWFGLSLHHLDTAGKRALMTAIRKAIAADGLFLVYEPTMQAGEDRAAYLARFDAVNRPLWRTILSEEQWRAIDAHVHACDLPETAEGWLRLGREAGFSHACEIYAAPTDLYRMYRFDP